MGISRSVLQLHNILFWIYYRSLNQSSIDGLLAYLQSFIITYHVFKVHLKKKFTEYNLSLTKLSKSLVSINVFVFGSKTKVIFVPFKVELCQRIKALK